MRLFMSELLCHAFYQIEKFLFPACDDFYNAAVLNFSLLLLSKMIVNHYFFHLFFQPYPFSLILLISDKKKWWHIFCYRHTSEWVSFHFFSLCSLLLRMGNFMFFSSSLFFLFPPFHFLAMTTFLGVVLFS